jgi:cyclopropane fatty-acyl-phospholipid synthase-like methyltransferase
MSAHVILNDMRPADPSRDYRPLVRNTYDQIAADFNSARVSESADELAPLLAVLPAGATVLDLGCGNGVPIARTLSASHTVIGVDFSGEQIALARKQAPNANLIQADMASCAFRRASLDAVVSFYAIFHLPLSEHAPLIARVSEWLKLGGYLLATFSPDRQEGYTEDFFGAEMYWSNLSLPEYRAMLLASGYEILSDRVVGHGYADEAARPEHHPLIFARKAR